MIPDDGFLLPPHSTESEQGVLGALLLDWRTYDRISWLRERDFYSAQHRAIYGAILTLIESGRQCDPILCGEALQATGRLDDAGGMPYIGALAHNVPGTANIAPYARIVRERSQLRQMIAYAADVQSIAYSAGAKADKVADQAEQGLTAIFATGAERDPVEARTAYHQAVEWLDNPHPGLPSDLIDLDKLTGGFKPGELILLAGRPSMGKSALAQQIAEYNAQSIGVAYFSLEMSARQMGVRGLRYHDFEFRHTENPRSSALAHAAKLKLVIDDTSAVTVGHIRSRCRRILRTHGLGMIVIDYLQMMRARSENRLQEISEISRSLKSLAKDFDVPVIACAQLSRQPAGRADHRPELSDLRESGQLEQDADVAIMLYRDDKDEAMQGITEALVRKNRDGATGVAYLDWQASLTRFRNHTGQIPTASGRPTGHAFRAVE